MPGEFVLIAKAWLVGPLFHRQMCTRTYGWPLGAVWTQLPAGSGRIRTAAVVIRASSREAALYFQPYFSAIMGLAGKQDI